MGKYMKKSKITAYVAVMEVPPPSYGVRTRAGKTIALQRRRRPSHSPSPLTKPDVFEQQNVHLLFQWETEESGRCCRKRLKSSNCRPNSKLRFDSFASESVSTGYEKNEGEVGFNVQVEDNRNLARCKPSFAESHLEFDEGNWSTYSLPTSNEVEEFFASVQFIEKYNFDIVDDAPLSGQYEWVE